MMPRLVKAQVQNGSFIPIRNVLFVFRPLDIVLYVHYNRYGAGWHVGGVRVRVRPRRLCVSVRVDRLRLRLAKLYSSG